MVKSRRKRVTSAPARPRAAKKRPPAPAKTSARAAVDEAPAPESRPPSRDLPTPLIVGVGASAGGLEAFSALLNALPASPGFALVHVQHLAPHHESALPTLLAASTKLPVVQAADGMRIEQDTVYVIPPNTQMGVDDGRLHLMPRPHDASQYVPIDFLFRSLADAAGDKAIGVVLSGTASDGAAGIRDIKSAGGIAIAQDPASAKYDGMPRAAIATGMVDVVLPPDRIAAELVEIARHPFLKRTAAAADDVSSTRDEQLQRVFELLRAASGVDFRHYKRPTIERRLQRRMVLHKLTRLDPYVRHLQQHPGEVQALYQDLLIHVTRFFRDPESIKMLVDTVFPDIIAHQLEDHPIRVWIAGCSTGEEAYSVAIALLEALGERANAVPIQIFATDVSEHAIEHARNGTYPESIAVDVSPERLRRFFTKVDAGYRVTKVVRDLCIFARQDLLRDPPFSKLDLIVCRNVLIYMTTTLQNRLLTVFHYALKPSGYLMLGHAETVGSMSDYFAVEEKRHRIYRKSLMESALPVMSFHAERLQASSAPKKRPDATIGRSPQHEADRIELDRYAPPGVIVDDDLQIVQFRGQTGTFLEPAPGDPSMSLVRMAREGLLHGVRTAFQAARKTNAPARKDGLKVKRDGGWQDVGVEVIPLAGSGRGHSLVLFHTDGPGAAAAATDLKTAPAPARKRRGKNDDARVGRLESELAASREYLQSIVQEVEAANEELQSANEEILSSNEELQSTNEELDTAKEELQSTNEELNTLNEELHGRNAELSRANSDLVNLLASIQIAIVIVANDLRVRRFTPMAERFLNLIASDVGRPIGHIKPNFDCPDLEEMITTAIDTVAAQERELQDRQGNWFSLRIRPYRNVENRIDGAVVALFDIHNAKVHDGELLSLRRQNEALLNAVPIPLLVLDESARIQRANRAFCDTFGYHPDGVTARSLFELDKGAWDIPALRERFGAATGDRASPDAVRITHAFPRVGKRTLDISLHRVGADGDGAPASYVVTIVGDGASVVAG